MIDDRPQFGERGGPAAGRVGVYAARRVAHMVLVRLVGWIYDLGVVVERCPFAHGAAIELELQPVGVDGLAHRPLRECPGVLAARRSYS